MKTYESPQLEEIKVHIEDVIAGSNWGGGDNENGGDWGTPGGGVPGGGF